jgi:hypothetical protein
MKQRGRKSTAQLSVVAGSIDGRPLPPEGLSEQEQEIWRKVVSSENADFFHTATLRQLLAGYCRHTAAADWLSVAMARALAPDSDAKVSEIDRLSKVRDREQKAAVTIATKLRLTNQSRYQPSVAATKSKQASGGERKLWERRA